MIYVVNKYDIMIFISVETPTETTTVAVQGIYIIFLRWISKFEGVQKYNYEIYSTNILLTSIWFEDDNGECEDKHDWCSLMVKNKDCCSETVRTECPKTCEECPSGPGEIY